MGIYRSGLRVSLLLFLVVLVLACAVPEEAPQPGAVAPPKQVQQPPAAPPPAALPTVSENLDPEIASLVRKAQGIDNYQYNYDAHLSEGYTVYLKGNKAKKMYSSLVKLRINTYYDEVYVDQEQQTATAICSTLANSFCIMVKNKAFRLNYAEQAPVQPLDLLKDIPASAKRTGTEQVDNRATIMVEFINEQGKLEKLSLDTYYGVPLKQEIYTVQGDEQTLQRKHLFTQLSVGTVKTAEVSLPAGYQVE